MLTTETCGAPDRPPDERTPPDRDEDGKTTLVTTAQPNAAEISKAIEILACGAVELRALWQRGRKRTDAGYFDAAHHADLTREARRLNAAGAAVYVTLNPVDPQLLGRYSNRIEQHAQTTTTDANIVSRKWLLIDFDPARPKDTSATNKQLDSTKEVARASYTFLQTRAWPEPVVTESGNGIHLLYPLDLENTSEATEAVKAALNALADRFDTDIVKLDRSVFNAARIVKLYGTVANKGDNTAETPWRVSRIVRAPKPTGVVTLEQLKALSPVVEAPKRINRLAHVSARGEFSLDDFLSRLGIELQHDVHNGSDRYRLAHCPFNAEHGKGEAAIFRQRDGALGFKCQHNGCADKHWQDLRTLVDGPKELRRGQLVSSLEQAREPRPDAPDRAVAPCVALLNGADITPEPIRWLWNGYLARGKFHVLAGAAGTGKTTLAIALAATVTIGGRWPDGTRATKGNVLIWSGEDDPKDTLVPRLLVCGADMACVRFVGTFTSATGERRAFDPATDIQALRDSLLGEDVALLIVDPVVSAVGGDSHKNAEVRRSLQPVVDLAALIDCAALGISHFTKATSGRDPVERVTGSIAFGAVPRVVLAAAKLRNEDGEKSDRLLARAKSNIGPDSGGFRFNLEQVALPGHEGLFASQVLWAEALEGSARELLANADVSPDGQDGDSVAGVAEWLRNLLTEEGGRITRTDVMKAARAMGYKERTVHRARTKLGLIVQQQGFGKYKRSMWMWRRPDSAIPASIVPIVPNQEAGAHGTNGGTDRPKTVVEVEV